MNLPTAFALAILLMLPGCTTNPEPSDDATPAPQENPEEPSSDAEISWPQIWSTTTPGELQFDLPAGSYDLTFFLKEGALLSFEIISPASCDGGGLTGSVLYPETSGSGIHHYISCRDVAANATLELQVEAISAHGILDVA